MLLCSELVFKAGSCRERRIGSHGTAALNTQTYAPAELACYRRLERHVAGRLRCVRPLVAAAGAAVASLGREEVCGTAAAQQPQRQHSHSSQQHP